VTDTQIASFVERLNADKVKPEELAAMPVGEFKRVTDYLEQRRQLYLRQYTKAVLASCASMPLGGSSAKRTYSENEILSEFGDLE